LNSTTGTISNLYSNILAVNNNNTQRATNDIFEVCTSSTSKNTSVFGPINTSNSALSWFINQNRAANFPTLNVNGSSSISTNLCIGSTSMRTSSDKLNVSTTSTGPYLFFNDGGTLGTYDTTNSIVPWFVEMSGYGRFDRISCINEQIDNDIITSNTYYVSLTTPKLTLLTSTANITVYLTILMPSRCLNNLFEFRVLNNPSVQFL